MEIIERDDLLSNVRARGEQLISELRDATRDIENVFDIRGLGLVGPQLIGPSLSYFVDISWSSSSSV